MKSLSVYLFFFFLLKTAAAISQQSGASAEEKYQQIHRAFWKHLSTNPDSALIEAKEQLLLTEKSIPEKIPQALNCLGLGYTYIHQYDSALSVFEKCIKISDQNNNHETKAQATANIGIAYFNMSEFSKSIDYYERAIQMLSDLSKTGKDSREMKRKMSTYYSNLAASYQAMSNFPKTVECALTAVKISESISDPESLAKSYENLANVYINQSNFMDAEKYYTKVLHLSDSVRDEQGMSNAFNNLGSVNYAQGKFPEALDYYKKSLDIRKNIGDKRGIAESLLNCANIYFELGNHEKSLEYELEAIKIEEEIHQKNLLALSLANISETYMILKQPDKAIDCLEKALILSKEIHSLRYISYCYEQMSSTYAQMERYEEAYEAHQHYSDIKDSMLNEESSKQIAEMQTKYETEKKEQQITLLNKDKELQDAQLNRQKIIIWSVAGGLLVVLILSIFIFRERRKSEKLLLNILPVETAKELKAKGKATARHYESVTVMFTDFKGFTTIAEKLSAEELVSELDFLFKKFDEIISKYNIEKIKTIGDAYMCASGLPTPNPNHAENIVMASLEIQQWMINQNNKWQLRIGIHSGPVTAGVVGDKKFAYDIWGDTVNTASRMESSGEPGKINISGSTYQLISPLLVRKDSFGEERSWGVNQRGKIPAKNKGEIDMYFVERA